MRDKTRQKTFHASKMTFSFFLSAGNGYIEGKELDDFLVELVTSINKEDVGSEVGTIHSVVVIYY